MALTVLPTDMHTLAHVISLVRSESHLSVHTWPEHGYAAVDIFTCGPSTQMPCNPREQLRYDGGWTCEDGSTATLPVGSGLWAAVSSIIKEVNAKSATVLWIERGMQPTNVRLTRGARIRQEDRLAYGLLGGLERGTEQ